MGSSNLILLCKNCHGKVTSGVVSREQVVAMKRTMIERFEPGVALSEALRAQQAINISATILGNKNIVAGGDVINTPKIVKKNVIVRAPGDISEEEAAEVKRLIDELAEIDVTSGRPDSHGKWYGKLYKTFSVTSYKTIPQSKLEAILSWLRQQTGRNTSKLRRTDNDKWRNRRYTAIYAKANQIGLSKDQIYQLAADRLELKQPVFSLKELPEQKLDKLYRVMMGM